MPNPRLRFLPLIAFIAVLAWPLLGLPMRYMANDDLGISAFLSRGLDSTFFGILPGRIVRAGHLLLGADAPVYALFSTLMVALCSALGVHMLLRDGFQRHGAPTTFALLALHAASMFGLCIWPTFTTVAATLTAHGLWAVIASRSHRLAFLGGLLVMMGYLIRSHSAQLVLALWLVPLGIGLFRDRQVWRHCLTGALATLLLFAGELALRRYALTPGYREFSRFLPNISEAMYQQVLDAARNDKALLATNRWSETDFVLFANWFYHDEAKFNADTIGRMVASAPRPAAAARPHRITFRQFMHSHSYFLNIAYALLVFALLQPSRRFAAALALHSLLYVGLGWCIETRLRFPIRVREAAMNAALLGGMCLWLQAAAPALPNRFRRVGLLAAALVLGGWYWLKHANLALVVRWDRKEQEAALAEVNSRYAGRVLVLWHNASFAFETLHPFRPPKLAFDTILFGWTTFSELYYLELQRLFGLSRGSELWPALARDPRVLFVAQREGMDLIRSTLAESYGLSVHPVLVGEVGTRQFWKLSPETPAASPGSP